MRASYVSSSRAVKERVLMVLLMVPIFFPVAQALRL